MICPDCLTALTEQQIPGGIIHVCPACEGITITLPFLRKQGIDPDYLNQLWRQANQTKYTARACPHCQEPMKYAGLSLNEQPLMLDVCTRCSLVWFDYQEYSVLSAYKTAKQPAKEISYNLKVALLTEQLKERSAQQNDLGFADSLEDLVDNTSKSLLNFRDQLLKRKTDPPQRLPIVTYALAGLLIVIFAATLRNPEAVIQKWGFIPSLPARSYGLTLLTSFFLHADIVFFFDNLCFLLIFGKALEAYLGRLGFVIALICSQLGGLIIMTLFFSTLGIPCIGANAGLAGVLAYYAILFPKARVGGLFLPTKGSIGKNYGFLNIPAFNAFSLWIIMQILICVLNIQDYSQPTALASLGGAGLGLVAGLLLKHLNTKP